MKGAPEPSVYCSADECTQHLLGSIEVGYRSILERANMNNITGRAAEHLERALAYRNHIILIFAERDYCRLVYDKTSARFVNKS